MYTKRCNLDHIHLVYFNDVISQLPIHTCIYTLHNRPKIKIRIFNLIDYCLNKHDLGTKNDQ